MNADCGMGMPIRTLGEPVLPLWDCQFIRMQLIPNVPQTCIAQTNRYHSIPWSARISKASKWSSTKVPKRPHVSNRGVSTPHQEAKKELWVNPCFLMHVADHSFYTLFIAEAPGSEDSVGLGLDVAIADVSVCSLFHLHFDHETWQDFSFSWSGWVCTCFSSSPLLKPSSTLTATVSHDGLCTFTWTWTSLSRN